MALEEKIKESSSTLPLDKALAMHNVSICLIFKHHC